MTLENFIKLLNDDLRLERKSQLQYERHSSLLTGYYVAFAEELNSHAEEERGHAVELCELITVLGGEPTMEGTDLKDAEQDNKAMLSTDREDETTAITRYTERIKQATLLELFFAVKKLQDIINDESHHFNFVNSILEGI